MNYAFIMTTIPRPWSGKKEPTNPVKKEQHSNRKNKKHLIRQIMKSDWLQQLKEYDANK